MTKLGVLLLAAVLGCGSSSKGTDAGGHQDAGGADTGCTGSAGFGCIFGGCRGDVGTAPVCTNGTWACPTGATDSRTCGGCTGNPPPDYVCADGGWVPGDAGGS